MAGNLANAERRAMLFLVRSYHGLKGICMTIHALERYRLLGRSGLRVSPIALGTMTFGETWGWGADPDEARRIFDAYVDRGGNLIDTAVN